jgi:hypothetical protein
MTGPPPPRSLKSFNGQSSLFGWAASWLEDLEVTVVVPTGSANLSGNGSDLVASFGLPSAAVHERPALDVGPPLRLGSSSSSSSSSSSPLVDVAPAVALVGLLRDLRGRLRRFGLRLVGDGSASSVAASVAAVAVRLYEDPEDAVSRIRK